MPVEVTPVPAAVMPDPRQAAEDVEVVAQGVDNRQPGRVAPGEGGFLVLHDENGVGVGFWSPASSSTGAVICRRPPTAVRRMGSAMTMLISRGSGRSPRASRSPAGMSAGSESPGGSVDSLESVGMPRQARTMPRCRASHLVCMPGTGTLAHGQPGTRVGPEPGRGGEQGGEVVSVEVDDARQPGPHHRPGLVAAQLLPPSARPSPVTAVCGLRPGKGGDVAGCRGGYGQAGSERGAEVAVAQANLGCGWPIPPVGQPGGDVARRAVIAARRAAQEPRCKRPSRCPGARRATLRYRIRAFPRTYSGARIRRAPSSRRASSMVIADINSARPSRFPGQRRS